MAYDPNDPLEMLKAEAREEGSDYDANVPAVAAAARAMLAALKERRDELNRRWPPASGMTQTVIDAKTAKLDALIAQAEAAGITSEPAAHVVAQPREQQPPAIVGGAGWDIDSEAAPARDCVDIIAR